MLILNIGLARKGKPNVAAARAVAELFEAGFTVEAHTVHQSNTEPTLVAIVKPPKFMVDERINAVSCELGQECIGVYNLLTAKGTLIGPSADKWGEFNGEYFLLLNGDRLVTPTARSAA